MDENKEIGILYVLTNNAMPGLIKIGTTLRSDINERLKELYKTGVPLPFNCEWAGEFENCKKVEQNIHLAFTKNRINLKREFFNIEPAHVIPLLKQFCVREITAQIETVLNKDVTEEEKKAAKEFHRPMLNLEEMNIPVGSELLFIKEPSIVAEVIAPKKVKYNDEEYSLTALTKKLLENDYNVAPCPFWNFDGKNLQDIYNETYTSASD